MNKKERKQRIREKRIQEESRIQEKQLIGVTVGGPAPGVQFVVDPNAKFHKVLLTSNPHYSIAIYTYTKQLTATGEMVAVFIRCIKR